MERRVSVFYNNFNFIRLDNVTGFARVVVKRIYYPDEGIIRASEVLVSCSSKEQARIAS